MKTNDLGVVMICAFAGLAVSCTEVTPHAMNGPVDDPQVRQGNKVAWSSADHQDYDVYFPQSPCSEGQRISVVSGNKGICTVKKTDTESDTSQIYTYYVGPPNFVPYSVDQNSPDPQTVRALVVRCPACGDVKLRQLDVTLPTGASVGLQNDGLVATYYQCKASTGIATDDCVYRNQRVEWQISGAGTTLTVNFTSETPCVNAAGQSVDKFTGKTTDGSLPMFCTIGPNATQTTYKYTFQIDGGSMYNASVTVK
jgi:hypothetical protein